MNFTGDLRSRNAVPHFLKCFIILLASASGYALCSTSSFSRNIGYILRGFLLAEVEVSDMIECQRRCMISANCLSLNILANADETLLCQLNSGRKENGVSEQFVQHEAGEYYGLKEKKLFCNSDGKTCNDESPWHAFNQSYFQYVRTPVLHSTAQAHCRQQNAGLASISSEGEQAFLYKTFIATDSEATRVVHIGMNDTAKEGVYVWEDGSPVTHTRWLKDDPNGSEEENCIGLYRDDGGFVDVKCDTESFFICKTNYGALIF